MDDLVRQAMAKWPNVPDCFGWLGLDARGDWYMRDDQAQALGPFEKSKGSRLQHEKLIDFIGRNYESDQQGRWYFQNGPQRVYVELEVTPWVWRIQTDGTLQTHTGEPARMQRCYADELGRLFIETDRGLGLVHSQDVHLAVEPIEQGLWVLNDVESKDLELRFGFVTSPQESAKKQA
jgi:hypothetical protein